MVLLSDGPGRPNGSKACVRRHVGPFRNWEYFPNSRQSRNGAKPVHSAVVPTFGRTPLTLRAGKRRRQPPTARGGQSAVCPDARRVGGCGGSLDDSQTTYAGGRHLALGRGYFVDQAINEPGVPRHRGVGNRQFLTQTKVAPGQLFDIHHGVIRAVHDGRTCLNAREQAV